MASDYLQQLKALLPQGPAWLVQATDRIGMLLAAWADEFARIEQRALALVEESDPRTTIELLADWERVAGLPDPCVTQAQTIPQRQAALVSKLSYTGGASRAYFIGMAAEMGYAGATIDEYPSIIGITDQFTWRINLPGSSGSLYYMDADSDADAYLLSWDAGNEALECRINKYKPAHTTVIYNYV